MVGTCNADDRQQTSKEGGRVHIPKDQGDGQEIDGRMRCTKTQKGWTRTGKEPSTIGTAGGGC